MRKFKHKQTGEEVKEFKNDYYLANNADTIHKRFIENSSDWEEIIEKTYEVLAFKVRKTGYVFNKTEVGKFQKEGSTILHNEEDLNISYFDLISVKRLEDGEVITVGDNIEHAITSDKGTILSIQLIDDNIFISTTFCDARKGTLLKNAIKIKEPLYTTFDGVERYEFQKEYWVINDRYEYQLEICSAHLSGTLTDSKTFKIFSTMEALEAHIESLKPKPLFHTEEGVEIFEGSTYWCVNTNPRLWSLYKQTAKERTQLNRGVLAFSEESLAKEYIIMNKTLLSLNDILSVWQAYVDIDFDVEKNSKLFKRIKELAKTK